IHVQLEYPFKTPPRSVALLWGTYPRDFIRPDRDEAPISDVEAVLIAAGSLDLIKFTRTEPEFVWHPPASAASRFVAVPEAPPAPGPAASPPLLFLAAAGLAAALLVLALATSLLGAKAGLRAGLGVRAGCLIMSVVSGGVAAASWKGSRAPAAPVLDNEQVLAIFGPLHANIYRAFDYTRDTEIFDALARSVDGPLLDKVYDEIYRGLIMQEEGGALSRVKQVMLSETTVLAPTPADTTGAARYGIKARWKVDGIVYHWGHAHERTNEYTAEYRIAQGPSGWRIVDLKPLEQRRIETQAQANSAASVAGPAQKESGVWKPQR
ncbi:MAG: hypothetical protein NTV94_15350, partial [Planctomycetota bacterium]|nr:hypothetical protein [Planctomycetota bacterium]